MKNRLIKILLLTSLSFVLTNCGFYYLLKDSYIQLAPEKYNPSKKRPVYVNTINNMNNMYNELFSDFLIIGKSSLTAEYNNADKYIKYGKKVGADIVIVSFTNMHETEDYYKVTVPREEKTVVLETTSESDEIKSKKITVYKNEDKYISYTIVNFDQDALFLKEIGGAKAPWKYTKGDFIFNQENDADSYLGNWRSYKTCKIEINSTKNEYLGFVNESNCKQKTKINKTLAWNDGDIKLRINKKSKQGFYLDQDKIPISVKSQFNKFGHLELIDQITNQIVVSFQKN